MFKRKALLAAVPLVLGTLALTACSGGSTDGGSGDETAAASGGKIGAFVLATANAYSQKNIEGVEMAAEEAGFEVEVFDGAFDGATQLAQMQDAIATGQYAGFVVFPNDGAAVVPGVQEAADAGIPVVAAYAPIGTSGEEDELIDGVIGTVLHPNAANGTELGELTVQACEEQHADSTPCKVGYISGGNSILFEQVKLEAFKAAIEDSGVDIELVSQQEGNFLVADSRTATENMLQATPDIDVIATSGDQMTIGAQQAVEDAGLTDVSLIGNGASIEGVEQVAAGTWFGTPVFMPIDEGYLPTKMLVDAINGTAPTETFVNVLEAVDAPLAITSENAADFTAQWSAAG